MAETSNLKNRPIGIGVQGLADVLMLLLTRVYQQVIIWVFAL